MSIAPRTLRITALATHPIQYHAPWFRALAALPGVELEVLFEYLPDARAQGEGFGEPFRWDIPLLDGYRHRVLSPVPAARSRVGSLRALAGRLAARRPHVVLLTGWHSAVLLAAPTLAHRVGARCLVRGESNDRRPRPAWVRRAHRTLLARYDAFLAVGSANRAFYLANGVAETSIFSCPYLVDNERFAAGARSVCRDAARARFAIPHDVACFLFAGKLESKKRPLDVVAAAARVSGRPLHLLVVGSGEQREAMRSAARGLPVTFAGFLNQGEMPVAYAAADCLVLPSDHGETWGLVVNEAMACGVPAIVSDQVGCAPDLVLSGETGWIFPTGDVTALAARIREAASDRRRLAAMGARARTRVHEGFSPQRAADAVLEAACSALRAGHAH